MSGLWRVAAVVAAVWLGVFAAPASFAQDADIERMAARDDATTNDDPDISVSQLGLLLQPLRRDALVVEAEGWIGLVQAKVAELSAVEIEIGRSEGQERTDLQQRADQIRSEKTRLIERASVVTAALATKGGDITEFEQYLEAVSGLQLDVQDTAAALDAVTRWLSSPEGGLKWGRNLLFFLLVLIAARIVANIAARIVRQAVKRMRNASELLRDFFVNITRQLIFLIGIVVAIGALGVNIGPLVAAIGAVGFIVGFALQGTLSNFASGIMILLYRPYDVGQVVDVAGVSGKVEAMTLVSTTILTFDNQVITVPNNSIWGSVIKNITGRDTRRVDMTFGIGYGDDPEKARGILEDIVNSHELVLKDPEPTIELHELGDSSVNFIVRPWSKTADYWRVYWDITRDVKKRFDAEGVSIPFPQMDVHLDGAVARGE